MTDQCTAAIWKRDTYRYTGRTKSGFELDYKRERCSRKATKDGRCWQHGKDMGFEDYDRS